MSETREPDAAYGLRARGVVVEELPRSGVIDFTHDALARDFAAVAELRLDPGTPLRVFRLVPGAVPELRPVLRPAAEPPEVTAETTWQVGPHRADAEGKLRWAGKDPVALVEQFPRLEGRQMVMVLAPKKKAPAVKAKKPEPVKQEKKAKAEAKPAAAG